MRWTILTVTMLLLAVWPQVALGQRGGGMGGQGFGRELAAPKLPGPELEGPPDSASLRPVLNLTQEQAIKYAQLRDSFMVATKVQRDSAELVQDVMYQRLDSGDRAAAMFYAERLQELGKSLKDRQTKFEDQVSSLLTGDQVKAYRQWKKEQDQAAEAKARQEAMRWRQMPFGSERAPAEEKVFINEPGVVRPEAGSQAVRVGRTIYVSSQVALDADGKIVGEGDLRAQAVRAFANLTSVLSAARALPGDVVRLTIYVVNYRPDDLSTIREAGAAYFPARNPPVITVLGVQSLSRDGLLIAVEATAVPGGSASSRREPPEP